MMHKRGVSNFEGNAGVSNKEGTQESVGVSKN